MKSDEGAGPEQQREPNDERQRVGVADDQWDGVAVPDVEWQREQHQRIEPGRPVRGRFSECDSTAQYACYGTEAFVETDSRGGPSGCVGEESFGRIAHGRQSDIDGEVKDLAL